MKIRMGFVSNSSSSSFTCNVCNTTESGWDAGLADVGMYECINDHTFCEDHVIGDPGKISLEEKRKILLDNEYIEKEDKAKIKTMDAQQVEDYWDNDFEYEGDRYEVLPKFCPICQFQGYNNEELVQYFLKKNKLTASQLLKNLKEEFGNYDKFVKYIGKGGK